MGASPKLIQLPTPAKSYYSAADFRELTVGESSAEKIKHSTSVSETPQKEMGNCSRQRDGNISTEVGNCQKTPGKDN